MARRRKIKEPYYTQIQLLPANACLFRYRQVHALTKLLNQDPNPSGDACETLGQMESSLLYQLEHFATEAQKTSNNLHPMANYLLAVANLIVAYHSECQGDTISAEALVSNAHALINAQKEPHEGIHYMHAQYHIMNYDEFSTFRTMS